MTNEINGKKIASLVAPSGVEHTQLIATWQAVRAAGGTPVLVSTTVDPVVTVQAGVPSKESFAVDRLARDLIVGDYAALVLPGGEKSSEALRGNGEAVRLVVDFVAARKPVAAISHGVGILVDAGVLAGKSVTSWPRMTRKSSTREPAGPIRTCSSVRIRAGSSSPEKQPLYCCTARIRPSNGDGVHLIRAGHFHCQATHC